MPTHTVPVVVLTGVDRDETAAQAVALQFDLPDTVAVGHTIDPGTRTLTRVVSDVTGVVERAETHLAHPCVTCALREDVLPTLERVARDGRWRSVLLHLPAGADARQVCLAVHDQPRLAALLHVSTVVAVLAGGSVVADLLGPDALADRGAHCAPEDRRGLGETGCLLVEHADAVVLTGEADEEAVGLVRTLARPDARVTLGPTRLEGRWVLQRHHHLAATARWGDAVRDLDLPPCGSAYVWRVELTSSRPFHPRRLLEGIGALAGGRHRSRGCFWLPSRPGRALTWDGAGGHLSIGHDRPWGSRPARTRLLLTGVGAAPPHLPAAFERYLLAPGETGAWQVEDGFEDWLGPVGQAA